MQPPESTTEAPASTPTNTHPEFHPQAPQEVLHGLPFDHDIDPVIKRHLEDVDMVDITVCSPLSSLLPPSPSLTPFPSLLVLTLPQPISTPKRVHTPSRLQYQLDPNGASASNGHPDALGTPPPGATTTGPRRVNASHGAPVRRYLNEKVTGVLLEGMKKVGREQ